MCCCCCFHKGFVVTGCIHREPPKGREIPHLKAQTYSLDLCLEFKTVRCLEALNEQPWTPVLREKGEIKI